MTFKSIRTTTSYDSGKRYIEFTINEKPSTGDLYIGVDQGVNNYVSPTVRGPGEHTLHDNCVTYKSDGGVFSRTSSLVTPTAGLPAATLQAGDVVSLLIDLDAGTLSFWKNGVSQQSVPYPAGADTYILVSLGKEGQKITANLSQDVAFTYPAPGGYTDWAGNAI